MTRVTSRHSAGSPGDVPELDDLELSRGQKMAVSTRLSGGSKGLATCARPIRVPLDTQSEVVCGQRVPRAKLVVRTFEAGQVALVPGGIARADRPGARDSAGAGPVY